MLDQGLYQYVAPAAVARSALLSTSQVDLTYFGRKQSDNSEADTSSDSNSGSEISHDASQSGSSDQARTETDEETSDDKNNVIPYVRVSTNEQKREGLSLESQTDTIYSRIEDDPELGAYLSEPIRDDGETGTDFDRDGIKRVIKLARHDEVTYLFADTIDRIGRATGETILLAKHLRTEHDVKLITTRKEYDVLKPLDKMQLSIMAASAEYSAMDRARSAQKSKIRAFIDHKQWGSWYNSVPIGYEHADKNDTDEDDGKPWIQPVDDMRPVIKQIFEDFVDGDVYADVCEDINSQYEDRIADHEQIDGEELTAREIKSVVGRSVYRGEPTLSVTSADGFGPHPSVTDESLRMVSDELFEQAQEQIAEIAETYGTNDEYANLPSSYADIFNPFIVDAVSPAIKLECPDCESRLNSQGQLEYDGDHASRMYSCSNNECDYTHRWPGESERNQMRMLANVHKFNLNR